MTCLPALLTACAVIAASLLGGCSDNLIGAGGKTPAPTAVQSAAPRQPATPLGATPQAAVQEVPPQVQPAAPSPDVQQTMASPAPPPPAALPAATPAAVAPPAATAPGPPGDRPAQRLASAALDDQDLSQIRGGFEASSGVVLNFAFQQATFVDHNLAQTVVVPTLTISPGAGGVSVAGASPTSGASAPNVNVSSLTGLGVSAQSQSGAIGGAKVLANGTVQTQVSLAAPVIQALVNSGMTSIVSSLGNGGLTSVISNTANNRVVQQMTTIDIGVSGLSSLVRQSISSSVLSRLSGPNVFR